MNKVKEVILFFIQLQTFFLMEFRKNKSLGLFKFLKNSKDGFFSISSILYNWEKNDKKEYISDWSRIRRVSKINDKRKIVIDDKLIFHIINKDNQKIKPVMAITKSSKIYKIIRNNFYEINSLGKFKEFVQSFDNGLIIKPHTGGGGARISKVFYNNDNLIFEGACNNIEDFYKYVVKGKTDFLLTEIINQTGVIHDIYPDSLNTIRILTMCDPNENKPFIACAVQRIGTKKSGIVDNFTAGGISASIDIKTKEVFV